ncbi:hypothetical protein [Atlantibacter hermannii]|uniref:hypothetical protein n=1 Tax=Atlantibacter hermannii TaxID=565 RepID=UPI0028B218B1|nr:hypothetical protein [Atlantibacter hermannii]
MSNTFRITKTVLSVPALGMPSPNNDGSTSMSGEHITAHVIAVKGNERLLVGRCDFAGMTTSGYDHSLTVIKPEGYQLVVETVDRYGIRNGTSRVRLKSEEVIESGDGWHLDKSGEAHIAGEPDSLQVDAERVGQNFVNDAYFQGCTIYNVKIGTAIVSGQLTGKSDDRLMKNAEDLPDSKAFTLKDNAYVFSGSVIASKTCLSDDMCEAVIDAVRNSEVFQSLVEKVNALSAERESDAVRLQRGIDQALSDTIRNALKPGGLLFNCGR